MFKKKKASSAIGYVALFALVLMMVVVTVYLIAVAKLMTHQHHVDDALADSVLASLVADDIYYFETFEMTGTPVVRFRNVDEAHQLFVECMTYAIDGNEDFYHNFEIADFICYEVEGNSVKITKYTGTGNAKNVSYGVLGKVNAPTGDIVKETSAYGKVQFDIESMIDRSYIRKSKDLYCTLEINN